MIKILELFAGIGACSTALDRLGVEHEIVDAVEIDKYAMASFNAIHGTNFEQGKVLNMDLYNQTTNENISQCLTDAKHNSQRLYDGLRIRKLTPKECWRLMRIP